MRPLLAAVVIFITAVGSAAAECSRADAQAAETATATFRTWSAIYSGFKRYRHCDDGGIAEGFTEAVVHLLASNWESLPKASEFAQKDKSFRVFFLRHIDASADADALRHVGALAQSQCPPRLEELCADIQKAVKQALGN